MGARVRRQAVGKRRRGSQSRSGPLMALTVLGVLVLGATACGSSSKSGGAATTAAGTTAATTPGATSTASSATTAASGDALLAKLFGGSGADPLAGKSEGVGASLTLSGTTATFGQDGLKGLQLAVKDIKAAGGPDIKLSVQDVQFDPTKGVQAVRQFVSSGIGVQATGASAVLGSQIPVIAQQKVLSFDPSAGVGTLPSKPYFWGAKGETPNGPWPGAIKYVEQQMPSAKGVLLVGAGGGSTIDDTQNKQLQDALAGTSLKYLGSERYPQGQNTDFSNLIQRVNGHNPDVIMLAAYANDPATFMKQYVAAGGTATVIGAEYTAEAAKAGGAAYDKMLFAQDNFLPTAPSNAWAKRFVDAYRAAYNSDPTVYSASYYDALFVIWQLMSKTAKANGNPQSGETLQTTLQANLGPYPSVVGTGTDSATLSFDATTHALSDRGYVLGKIVGGAPQPLAYYGVDGADFKLAS